MDQIRNSIEGLSIHGSHIPSMGQLDIIVENSNYRFADFVNGAGLIEFGTRMTNNNVIIHLSIEIINTNNGIQANVGGVNTVTGTFTINTVNCCLRDLGFL